MDRLNTLRSLIQKTTRGLSNVGMLLIIPMMLLTSGEVIGRAVWSKPIPGTLELSSYMLVVFILLGLAYTQQVKGHVKVVMFTSKLPPKAQAVLEILTNILSLFIVAILCWQGWVVGIDETTVSDVHRIVQWPFRLLVPLAALFLFLELAIDLVDACRKLVRS
jgi:TRAP-type C4-dicarboxylate transport system permease small subunit